MMAFILKIACLTACAGAAAVMVHAIVRRFGRCLHRRIEGERRRLQEAADLCGIELSGRWAAMLFAVAPVLRAGLGLLRGRRLARIDAQFPDALALLANALKAGLALPQALEMASIELAAPLGAELARAVAQLKLGRTVEEALALFARRVPTDEVLLVVQSVGVLRRTGGNLVETFGTLASTIEDRMRVEERIRVLTAQGVIQGAMLLAMPWLLSAALFLVVPEYLEPLFSTRLGLVLSVAALLLEAAGALWLRKVVTIRV